ncbi:MAG TPA: NAD-dependent epimerase/dehydratase family protein [Candidatus Saccharibacteria bacterium]|nr:NAD-dependent epimerase/dehydratase family protein [Candidatus Saccharibacteria bacterium]
MKSKTATCLVVGANGFVGSHIVDGLAARGFRVIAFDRYSSAQKFISSEMITKVKGDILSETELASSVKGVDYVFYSFSATTPFASEDNPYSDIKLNLEHSVSFFDACSKEGVKGFYYISSGGVIYGATAEHIDAMETDLPLPISPYGICKLAAENYLSYFLRKRNMKYVVFRLTNPYGPRQMLKNHQGVIPAFIKKIEEGGVITIYGSGDASRDYIFITDAVEMMLNVFESENDNVVYNIGCGKQTSLRQIVHNLELVYDRHLEVNYVDAPKTFLSKSRVSIERYCQEFGQPELLDMTTGLKKTLDYIRSH